MSQDYAFNVSKNDYHHFHSPFVTQNFFGHGKLVCFHCLDHHLVSGLKNSIHASSIVTVDGISTDFVWSSGSNLLAHCHAHSLVFIGYYLWNHLKESLCIFRFSWRRVYTVPVKFWFWSKFLSQLAVLRKQLLLCSNHGLRVMCMAECLQFIMPDIISSHLWTVALLTAHFSYPWPPHCMSHSIYMGVIPWTWNKQYVTWCCHIGVVRLTMQPILLVIHKEYVSESTHIFQNVLHFLSAPIHHKKYETELECTLYNQFKIYFTHVWYIYRHTHTKWYCNLLY